MNETTWELLTLPTDTLSKKWEISPAEVRRRRLEATGSARPLSEPWCYAVGSWGGVSSAAAIASRVRRSRSEVRDYAKGQKLKTAPQGRQRTQAELAVLLYADRRQPAKESCRKYGVLVVERHLLCTRLQSLLDAHRIPFAGLLLWSPERLAEEWENAGLALAPRLPAA